MPYNVNMKNKNILYTLVAIIIIALGVYFFNQDNTQANMTRNKDNKSTLSDNKTVNFGAVLALTGYAAIDAGNIKDGIEMAKSDLLKENINLNVEYFDDATDPKRTLTGVNLMHSKGYKNIFGPTWSYQISAALPVIAQNGMTALIADTSSDVVDGSDQDKAHLIHGISPIYQIQTPTEKWIKDSKVTNMAILTVDGTWGIAHTNAWIKAAQNTGINVGMKEMFTYTDEPTIISTLIIKAKSKKIDGIVWTGTEAGAISLVKKMQELNYNVPVLGTNYLKVAIDNKKVTVGGLNLNMIESARSEEFNKKYMSIYNKIPNKYAESSYDLTMIAAHAELDKKDKNIRDYIVSKVNNGFVNKYSFDKNGDVTNLSWAVTVIK